MLFPFAQLNFLTANLTRISSDQVVFHKMDNIVHARPNLSHSDLKMANNFQVDT
jgi:hypothetical protein